ncbi:MAG: DUF1573 domain-containing protein [Muribaculaceae bacterium]|nr:DUF1573 domain-containing protein [Muribaculaceae bacterium]
MKTFGFTILLSAVSALSASADVVWLEKEYDFGLMKEIAGPQTGSVRLVNTGPEEVVITGARPSCGCTGVAYNQDPIAPGDTATFSFTYNPLGRPGRFEKSIRVYIGDFDTYKITIKGNVLGTPESLSSLYPVEVGPMRLSETILGTGDVNYGSTRHFFVNAYNQTTDTIRPHWVCDNPALSVTATSEDLGPGDLMTLSLYFNSRDLKELGPVTIPVTVYADQKADSPSATLEFYSNVTPDFSKMSPEEINNGPRCEVEPVEIDASKFSFAAKPIPFKFTIRNEGKSPLQILRIYSKSDAVRVTRRPSVIKPEKSGQVDASVNLRQLIQATQGDVIPEAARVEIEVMTNDPLHPVRTLAVPIHSIKN